MPKQVYKITRFEGGTNSAADPRDINDNELPIARDVDISSFGRITMLGENKEHESTSGSVAGDTALAGGVAGTGLFSWSSDYRMVASDEDVDESEEDRTDYICAYEAAGGNALLALFQKQSDGTKHWGTSVGDGMLDMGGATATLSFYEVNGNLRVSDYSNASGNISKWLGVITPKEYIKDSLDDASDATRPYGDYNTFLYAHVDRTGGTSTYYLYGLIKR